MWSNAPHARAGAAQSSATRHPSYSSRDSCQAMDDDAEALFVCNCVCCAAVLQQCTSHLHCAAVQRRHKRTRHVETAQGVQPLAHTWLWPAAPTAGHRKARQQTSACLMQFQIHMIGPGTPQHSHTAVPNDTMLSIGNRARHCRQGEVQLGCCNCCCRGR